MHGYKYIVLEAPTGFGKSPVAIAVGRTLGTSYICSATKDLQTQYTNDFPYLRAIKGMGNYDCLVKEDFVLDKTYQCAQCKTTTDNFKECRHRNVVYGPCRDGQPGFGMLRKTVVFVQVRTAFMMAVDTGRIQKIMK